MNGDRPPLEGKASRRLPTHAGWVRGDSCKKSVTYLSLVARVLAQDPESLRSVGASVQPWPRASSQVDRRRCRRCARARGRAACDAPRAPGTASHLAQRSWAEPPWLASATRESNTFSLNFPASVPANTHSRTHTRARSEPVTGERTGTGGSLAASFSLPRSYWRGGYCFIYLFPPLGSIPPPRISRPAFAPSLSSPLSVSEPSGGCRSSCGVEGLLAGPPPPLFRRGDPGSLGGRGTRRERTPRGGSACCGGGDECQWR